MTMEEFMRLMFEASTVELEPVTFRELCQKLNDEAPKDRTDIGFIGVWTDGD